MSAKEWLWVNLTVFVGFAWLLALVVIAYQWILWTKVSLEGAGRQILVGIHGWSGDIFVYPHPLIKSPKATIFISPFIRPYAWIDPDRDEVRIKVFFEPRGAPAQSGEDRPTLILRLSWSVPNWVPYNDVEGEPGDHGGIPKNIVSRRLKIPREVLRHFDNRQHGRLYPRRIKRFIPGAVAIAITNKHSDGEHLVRLFEFAVAQAREVMSSFHVRDFVHASEDNSVTTPVRIHSVVVRDKSIPIPADIPRQYSNTGEMYEIISRILTWSIRLELEPYGVFVNDATPASITLPDEIVQEALREEGQKIGVRRMNTLADALTANVEKLREKNVDPTIAALLLGDTNTLTQTGPGPFAALLALVERVAGGRQ